MRHLVTILFLTLLFTVSLHAQKDTVYVESDGETGGNLNAAVQTAIDAGKLSTTVFKLESLGYYILTGTITVPVGEHLVQGRILAALLQNIMISLFHKAILQKRSSPGSQFAQNGPDATPHVFPGRLPHLHVNVQAAVLALPVQLVHQGQQIGRLASLPGGMQDKIFLLVNQR